MVIDIILSIVLVVVLAANMYCTFALNSKIKSLREYTKKLPALVNYVQKTMEAFAKSLVDLRESGEKAQNAVSDKISEAELITEELRTLVKIAEQSAKSLEKVRDSVLDMNHSVQRKRKINSVLDFIDGR